jgi:hypothetical protein
MTKKPTICESVLQGVGCALIILAVAEALTSSAMAKQFANPNGSPILDEPVTCEDGGGTPPRGSCESPSDSSAPCGEDGAGASGTNCDTSLKCECKSILRGCRCRNKKSKTDTGSEL